ncbi:MAG TPA: DEAD/DEAH box helicase [Actinomycetota bacterium]|nr:DEAD/DEAH box helicase [Actinomycetota bacterium]
MSLAPFSAPVRAWFETTFPEPTPAQAQGWPAIISGEHSLILAPTGSGKTLAAFLTAIDRLGTTPPVIPERRCRVLYISPLRALAVDVEKNLRTPLAGISLAAERLGDGFVQPEVGIRTGDTPATERRALVRHPPDILITTPESLYLMLTSQAREMLRGVETVIVDEIHALAGNKRGAHLALSLERLEELTERPPQRIGLSATQRPLEEIARFLGGRTSDGPRPVRIVDAGIRKPIEVEVVVPVEDMGRLGDVEPDLVSGPASSGPTRMSIWPAVHPKILELIRAHRSTIVFCNARRLAERLASRLNELAGEELVRSHHGSLAREQRVIVEDQLKRGELRGIVATSSLELGIDMGAVDLVVQVESPGSVARGLQRIGRAGHRVGEPSRGRIFPKYRGDLVEAAVVVRRMRDGSIEETRVLRNPLDVLAQQIVAIVAMDEWRLHDLAALVRRAAPFSDLSDEVLRSVLDMLAGRYPSEEFSELRPRLVWDRRDDTLRAREGAQRLAVTSGGTIPDRGLFGVFLPDGARVGELDEEMVYESRPGETFLLGASTWRIEEITHDRVIVTPAPGEPGKMPFWHGEGPGRPLELGRALGAFVRAARSGEADLEHDYGLDRLAAENLLRYLREQEEAAGAVPDDRTIVVERFRDEIGDWRVCVLSPFGARVHAPWAIAVQARLEERLGLQVEALWSDDGIVFRLPEAEEHLPLEDLLLDPEDVEDLVLSRVTGTALFASLFRDAAGRALLLPRRRPDRRTPLWQQRRRAADLLAVASRYPDFPILLETTRECLQDHFDLPALLQVLTDIRTRRIRVAAAETQQASPFAQSLLFDWIAVYMYEGDAPLAERRAQALALDRDLLRELLGAEELRDLIDEDVLEELELELQGLVPERRARSADELHDVLRRLGPLLDEDLAVRAGGDAATWIAELLEQKRAIRVTFADGDRVAAAEDAARLRDALGVALPLGLPSAFTDPVERPLDGLVGRYARTHGPFETEQVADAFGLAVDRVVPALERLEADGRLVRGEFRPGGTRREWCDVEVLRVLRRRSLARLRKEVEPVEAEVLGRFLPAWQGVGSARRGMEALAEVINQLQGAAIPASVLEVDVLAQRLQGYRPADLDELCASGDVVWSGAGPIGASDGRVALAFRDHLDVLPPVPPEPPDGDLHEALRSHLAAQGASFWPDLVRAAGTGDEGAVLAALWDLVWAGEVTNDTPAPLRAFLGRRPAARRGRRARPGSLRRVGPPAGAGRWSLLRRPPVDPTVVAHARALQLLERHGVLTREAAGVGSLPGAFSGIYPVLRQLEEAGRIRRGYFVSGLGGAQFALPGAIDRLRTLRDRPDEPIVHALAATDPAQPYGAALPWPDAEGRPARTAGAYVVLVDGAATAYLERGARSLLTFPAASERDGWADGLASLVKDGRLARIELRRIDGGPADASPVAERLRSAGFSDGYRGLTLRG